MASSVAAGLIAAGVGLLMSVSAAGAVTHERGRAPICDWTGVPFTIAAYSAHARHCKAIRESYRANQRRLQEIESQRRAEERRREQIAFEQRLEQQRADGRPELFPVRQSPGSSDRDGGAGLGPGAEPLRQAFAASGAEAGNVLLDRLAPGLGGLNRARGVLNQQVVPLLDRGSNGFDRLGAGSGLAILGFEHGGRLPHVSGHFASIALDSVLSINREASAEFQRQMNAFNAGSAISSGVGDSLGAVRSNIVASRQANGQASQRAMAAVAEERQRQAAAAAEDRRRQMAAAAEASRQAAILRDQRRAAAEAEAEARRAADAERRRQALLEQQRAREIAAAEMARAERARQAANAQREPSDTARFFNFLAGAAAIAGGVAIHHYSTKAAPRSPQSSGQPSPGCVGRGCGDGYTVQ